MGAAAAAGAGGFDGARDCAISENAAEPNRDPTPITHASRHHDRLNIIANTLFIVPTRNQSRRRRRRMETFPQAAGDEVLMRCGGFSLALAGAPPARGGWCRLPHD